MPQALPQNVCQGKYPNIEIEDREAEIRMKFCQQEVNANPLDMVLREKEKIATVEYNNIHKACISHLQ